MINNASFVLYESTYKQIERLMKKGMIEQSAELMMAIMEFGLYGVVPDDESDVWLYGFEQTITSISAAKDRYEASVQNGRKGGRMKTIDDKRIIELKEKGYSNNAVAEMLHCSKSSVEKYVSAYRKNQKNPNDNVNDNVNDNDNVNENDTTNLVSKASVRF